MRPNRFEHIRKRSKTFENVEKFDKNSRKIAKFLVFTIKFVMLLDSLLVFELRLYFFLPAFVAVNILS